MPQIEANGLHIEVEQHGDPSRPTVLLIMGLATQLVHWPQEFIAELVDGGHHVVTFDNRDIGLSEKLEGHNAPPPSASLLTSALGLGWLLAPYDLRDMAGDTVGVLDALDISDAHIVGVSMGGMIAQVLSARYPERIRSLTTIMSSTNRRSLPRADREIVRAIVSARSNRLSHDEQVERSLGVWRMISTRDGGRNIEDMRQQISDSTARCNYPEGVRRQIAAIIASGDLRKWARQITAPTYVVHGKADRLTPYHGSVDIAAAVRDAQLDLIEGMGHDLPPRFLPQVTANILEHIRTTDKDTAASKAA